MRAVVYDEPRTVSVKDMPDARIERPIDVLVKITTTNICGSDLHTYDGRTDIEPGRILGHENLGEVVDVGDAVDRVRALRQARPGLDEGRRAPRRGRLTVEEDATTTIGSRRTGVALSAIWQIEVWRIVTWLPILDAR